MHPVPSRPPPSALRRLLLATALVADAGTSVAAQSRAAAPARWSIVTPAGALAWFDLMAGLRLPGAGAFPLVDVRDRAIAPADRELADALARTRESEILHFVPLYHPSADRAALAAALRGAAASPPLVPTPRAELLVGALARSLAGELRSARLHELAAALERRPPVVPPAPARIARLQRELDSLYLPALAPWLALERLDGGRLIVAPGIGTEGRIFSGTQDRSDNQVAVGDFAADADPTAPLLAFVRELCFPAVTRASQGVAGFDASNVDGARRASLAAVRCGAALLDARLPARSDAYRAFWSRRAALASPSPSARPGERRAASALRADFDRTFPADADIAAALDRAISRLKEVR
ncbi:MAG: hypothetical protein K8S21_11635 [Gemmatimonadetes bacterium]|nr:hypothetical protein [Gemmatimonadota bacterium]